MIGQASSRLFFARLLSTSLHVQSFCRRVLFVMNAVDSAQKSCFTCRLCIRSDESTFLASSAAQSRSITPGRCIRCVTALRASTIHAWQLETASQVTLLWFQNKDAMTSRGKARRAAHLRCYREGCTLAVLMEQIHRKEKPVVLLFKMSLRRFDENPSTYSATSPTSR